MINNGVIEIEIDIMISLKLLFISSISIQPNVVLPLVNRTVYCTNRLRCPLLNISQIA